LNDVNLYGYAAGNPVKKLDRGGLATVPEQPKGRPPNCKEQGAEAHRDILPRLVLVLAAMRLPSVPLPVQATEEVPTQPGGSKPGPNAAGGPGRIDLIIFEYKWAGKLASVQNDVVIGHFYELKPRYEAINDARLKDTNQKVTWDRQLQNYLVHDSYEEVPGEI